MNLDDLKQSRSTLQAAAAAALQAVQRAQKEVADELFNVRECERDLESARGRVVLDAAQAALDSATKDHALAQRRLKDRQGEHAHADMEAHSAAATVVHAVDKILTDELLERSKQVEHHLNEARGLGLALRHFAFAAQINGVGVIPDSVQRVVDRLASSLVDTKEIKINLEREGDVPAYREWVARRVRMIE